MLTPPHVLSVVPGPGEPHRIWDNGDEAALRTDAMLLVQASGATSAVWKLTAHESLTADDLIAFNRLNSHCYIHGYEPRVLLYRSTPCPHPRMNQLLSGTEN